MSKVALRKIEGIVLELLPNTTFKVETGNGETVLATLKGKLRRSYVRVFPGDRVKIELPPHDDKRGRIIQKLR